MSYAGTIITIVLIIMLFTWAVPFDASAQGLIPCGEVDASGKVSNPCQPCHIFTLIQKIFDFIWKYLAAPLAILMLAWGGFLMIVPGVGGEKSVSMYTKGKKVLTNALIGLVIIFLAWLGVDTIIKALAGQDIGKAETAQFFPEIRYGPWNEIKCVPVQPIPSRSSAQPVPQTAQGGVVGATGSLFSTTETNVRASLAQFDIRINKNPCPPGKSYGEVEGGCTNTAGLPDLAILRLTSIKNSCGGTMIITGGSEPGHTSHGPGQAIVDIAFDSNIASCIKRSPSAFGIKKICASSQDAAYSLNCSTREQFRHLHIEFG